MPPDTSAGADVARCAFATADIETPDATMRARGVDPDGNRFLIVEAG